MVSATEAFAVGKNGRIAHWDGVEWDLLSSPTGRELKAISMISATDGFAVGRNGTIVRWNGTSWTLQDSPTAQHLFGLDCFSTTVCYGVGNRGTIVYWNGSVWTTVAPVTSNTLLSVHLRLADQGWGTGKNGTIVRIQPSDGYAGSGTYVSSVLDSAATSTVWDNVFWTERLVGGTDVTVATRSGQSATPDGSWSQWSDESADSTIGAAISSPAAQYLQYRLTLSTTNVSVTPYVDDLTVTYYEP